MNDWRLWAILFITVGTLLYTIVSNYAIRGNDLKHLKDAIIDLKKELLSRIERLEKRFFDKGEQK